ncbi:unnamed protein product, partial [Polarella glacialis]
MPAWMMSGQALMSGEADAPLPPPVPSRGEPGYSRYSRPEAPSRPDPEYPPPPTQSPAPSRPDPEYPPPPTQSPLILEDPFDHTDFEMQPDVVQERTQPRMPGADMRASPNLPPASASIATRTAVSAAQFFDAAQREAAESSGVLPEPDADVPSPVKPRVSKALEDVTLEELEAHAGPRNLGDGTQASAKPRDVFATDSPLPSSPTTWQSEPPLPAPKEPPRWESPDRQDTYYQVDLPEIVPVSRTETDDSDVPPPPVSIQFDKEEFTAVAATGVPSRPSGRCAACCERFCRCCPARLRCCLPGTAGRAPDRELDDEMDATASQKNGDAKDVRRKKEEFEDLSGSCFSRTVACSSQRCFAVCPCFCVFIGIVIVSVIS